MTAGKIGPKSLLTKSHQKEKMSQEIRFAEIVVEEGLNSVLARLHKGVSHAHLVKLFSYFEDSNFVYIVLELCRYCFCFPIGGPSSAYSWLMWDV